MKSIFENLDVSKNCFEEILIKIFENIENSNATLENKKKRVEGIIRAISQCRDLKYRKKALKLLGKAQKGVVRAENNIKKETKPSGIIFTPKVFS